MLGWLRKLLGGRPREFTDEEREAHGERMKRALESALGPMHDLVGHAIIPFELGGATDMYFFPQKDGGTAFATMEMIAPDGSGPASKSLGSYEFVAYSRHPYTPENEAGDPNEFQRIERHLCGIFTTLGNYGLQARLEPGETCEIPMDDEPNCCLVFDHGGTLDIDRKKHGLLLCIEIFREEMEFARNEGSDELLTRLREAGVHPRSDLDRPPVVPA